jgi:hypothetical protein
VKQIKGGSIPLDLEAVIGHPKHFSNQTEPEQIATSSLQGGKTKLASESTMITRISQNTDAIDKPVLP